MKQELGSTAAKYSVGDEVPLEFLIEQSIIYSDNTAVNILIKNIGQKEYRYEMQKYCEEELPEEFFEDNVTTATYSYNVVKYLYEHQEKYQDLIELAKKSSNGGYLKKYITQYDVAHKYGSYDGNVHDYGIVYAPKPYLIGVFTKGVTNAEELIANINSKILTKSQE